jgi:hypothetical protein
MASETQNAQSWQSIARPGSPRSPVWGGSSTALNAEDGLALVNHPWVTFPDPVEEGVQPIPQGYKPISSQILRVKFAAFSLPTDDIIASAQVMVRHKQGNPSVSGGRTIFCENANATLGNSYQQDAIAYPVIGLTISTLNSGNATFDLHYHAEGPNLVPALLVDPDPTSFLYVEHVTLSVTTIPEPTHTRDFESFRMVRIPEVGVR